MNHTPSGPTSDLAAFAFRGAANTLTVREQAGNAISGITSAITVGVVNCGDAYVNTR